MNESNKNIKKIIIIATPIIVGLLVYALFFKEKKSETNQVEVKTLIIPDSEKESVPLSKMEIYSQEEKEKRAKNRELELSKISTSDFFNKFTKDKEEHIELSKEEQKQKIDMLFSEDKPIKSTSSKSKKTNRWKTDEIEDQLSQYDLDKKKKKSAPSKKIEIPVQDETPVQSSPNTPGKRTRNNAIENYNSVPDGNLIPAVIHSDQCIKNGDVVKIRLLQDFYINGQKIPKNTFVSGIARFGRERVDIQITAIRKSNELITFNKSVYDKDGIKGLHFPENLGNAMSKEIGSDAIDEAYDIATSGSGIVGSVLSAGKTVLKRKNTEKKVDLKANYKIYLK